MTDLWIMLAGILVAVCCSLVGCFLLVRKMAMVGDAISHAVLPGIVLAYLATQSRSSLVTLPGAALMGVLITLVIEKLHKGLKVQTDAAIGVSFTGLFALGIILVSLYAGNIDLDQDCVLYGDILFVPFDKFHTGSFLDIVPRPVWILIGLAIILLLFTGFGFKGLLYTSFDPVMTGLTGVSVAVWHYTLMSLVSLTTVISFESVGAILVLALMIVPAAAARLLTQSLRTMLWLSAGIGALSAISGYYLAVILDASVSGAIATMAGVIFAIVLALRRLIGTRIRQLQIQH